MCQFGEKNIIVQLSSRLIFMVSFTSQHDSSELKKDFCRPRFGDLVVLFGNVLNN